MVNTLELPIRKTLVGHDPLGAYVRRFGGLPDWFDEITAQEARYLARRALHIGTPLSQADHLVF